MNSGFIKLIRSEQTRELQKDPNPFTLLSVIACRARRTDVFNVHNLKLGEALIGDCKNYGMTEQEYRTSKAKLKRWGFATFKATTRGTIAKLTDKRIYDINIESSNEPGNEPSNGQATDSQRTSNERATTNKNDKNDKNGKNEKNEKGEKTLFRDFVFLTSAEYAKLVDRFGKDEADGWIEELNNAIGSKGLEYESHYHTILTWAGRDDEKKAADKTKLFPIPGKICSRDGCGLPAVYKSTGGSYDHWYCTDHLPKKVKERFE
jgi:hypothetical protein